APVVLPTLLSTAVPFSPGVQANLGETNESLTRLGEGEHLLGRLAACGLPTSGVYYPVGRACLLVGRLDEARRFCDLEVGLSATQPGRLAHALHLQGDIATHPDGFDVERAEALYHQALALAEPRGMRPLVAHCHLGLGKL